MTTKQDLHRLIDELPECAIAQAAQILTELRDESNELPPVLRDAPEDDEPLTAEELAAIEEGEAEIDRGELIPWEEAKARLFGPD